MAIHAANKNGQCSTENFHLKGFSEMMTETFGADPDFDQGAECGRDILMCVDAMLRPDYGEGSGWIRETEETAARRTVQKMGVARAVLNEHRRVLPEGQKAKRDPILVGDQKIEKGEESPDIDPSERLAAQLKRHHCPEPEQSVPARQKAEK